MLSYLGRISFLIFFLLHLSHCSPKTDIEESNQMLSNEMDELVNFLNTEFEIIEDSEKVFLKKQERLLAHEHQYSTAEDSIPAILDYSKSLINSYKFGDALEVINKGLSRFTNEASLLSERGHLLILARKLEPALNDLLAAKAALAETYDSTTLLTQEEKLERFLVDYRIGIVYFALSDYAAAENSFQEASRLAHNDDAKIAVTDWRYLTNMRANKMAEAYRLLDSINVDKLVIQNTTYYKRILLYQNKFKSEELGNVDINEAFDKSEAITLLYGVASYEILHDELDKAKLILDKILDSGHWPTYAYLCAESDKKKYFAEY